MLRFICLFLLYAGAIAELPCTVMPGKLKQLDAGNGEVYGVADDETIYFLHSNQWAQIEGRLTHVTVGPAGVWGVNKDNYIYRLKNYNWIEVSGLLKQIDAGGDIFISGANADDDIYCVNQDPNTFPANSLPYVHIEGKLKHYACGPLGCWGINSDNEIYYRNHVTPSSCKGTAWSKVEGSLIMVEVGTDGSVFGVNSEGSVYKRDGISPKNPRGTSWTQIDVFNSFKYVSYDAGFLWLISDNGRIFKCEYPESMLPNLL
ncbi:fish-egg lectin-like [Xenopus laevis]|uniref:Fish-egg lectin-like n=1 Tax=Xenopus laevis TaxID=8355 RepID=A0A8J1LDR9_XENLA|nr:fish-egg lectin-like [Xenopus laevis]